MHTDQEFNAILVDEIREYLSLSDTELSGYGLNRRTLEKQLADLGSDLVSEYWQD